MTMIRAVAASLVLLLAACGQAAPQPDTATTTIDQAKPDASAPAAAESGLTSAMLVGRWGDNGDCTKDIVFDANGTFRSYTGGSGTWSLTGDIITMSGAGGTFTLRVQSLNQQQLLIGNPDGSIGISQRC